MHMRGLIIYISYQPMYIHTTSLWFIGGKYGQHLSFAVFFNFSRNQNDCDHTEHKRNLDVHVHVHVHVFVNVYCTVWFQ